MSDTYIRCKCNSILIEEDFIRHFGKCEEFRKNFKNFDAQLGELLKNNSDPKENLLIIRVLLKQYIMLLDKKIRASFDGHNGYPVNKIDNGNIGNLNNGSNANKIHNNGIDRLFRNDTNVEPNSNRNFINLDNKIDLDPYNNGNLGNNNYQNNLPPYNNNNNPKFEEKLRGVEINYDSKFDVEMNPMIIECCQLCKDLNYTFLDCLHQICVPCFQNLARKDFSNMKCIVCENVIPEDTKIMILGKEEYDKLEYNSLMGAIGNVVDCPQCKEKIVFEKGVIDYNIKNDKNEKLSKSAAEHYAENRCRCPSCKIDFCVGCKSNPYHIGKTCEDQLRFVAAKRCRYDDEVISLKNRGPADDVCSNPECVSTFKTACTKILKCGHKCWGCKGEKVCLPCIDKECNQYVNIYDQNCDSYCNICFTEGLGNAPLVILSCKHFIHYKCIHTRLAKKWIGPKITFTHCLCPQCNNWVDCPNLPEIQDMIIQNSNLYSDICKKAIERLKYEGLEKDPKLTDPNSKWYKKELEYALNRLSYYMCYQCQKPYFAGLRECGDGPNVNNNNQNREYDPKDLICGAHVNNYGVAGMTDCKIHGKEFIEYKCKFCCSIASWFCWGTTHFCEDCHARQCKGDYVSKYTKDKLPKCEASKCQLKVKHPDNGEEFGLGCSVCKNNNDNVKNF